MSTEVTNAAIQAGRLEAVYAAVAAELHQPGVLDRLRKAGGADEWSVMQILGHMTEMLPYWLSHCTAIIASTDELLKFGRALDAPERLEGVERGAAATPDALLLQLHDETQRVSNAIRAMSPSERDKRGVHSRLGEVTVAQLIEEVIITHAEDHLTQIRQTLKSR